MLVGVTGALYRRTLGLADAMGLEGAAAAELSEELYGLRAVIALGPMVLRVDRPLLLDGRIFMPPAVGLCTGALDEAVRTGVEVEVAMVGTSRRGAMGDSDGDELGDDFGDEREAVGEVRPLTRVRLTGEVVPGGRWEEGRHACEKPVGPTPEPHSHRAKHTCQYRGECK